MITSREVQLIRSFVVPSKRERYADFLSSPKRREKFLRELYHFADFDAGTIVELRGPNDSADGLIADLRRRGAPAECYLISVRSELDGQTRNLDQAIREVFAFAEGTIVCCVPGRLAYYEGEAPKNRFILHRRDAV
jgi:hypothetical protein